jgi:hypothetical protein
MKETFLSLRLTFIGRHNHQYRRATPDDESNNIDGFIGNIPVQIKPVAYKTKNMLHENIGGELIFYEKKKDGIVVEYDF